MMRFGIVVDPVFAEHENPAGHPENASRIGAVHRAVEGWQKQSRLIRYAPCTVDEHWLTEVHAREHLERIRRTEDRGMTRLDPDTFACSDSYRVALLAAGSCVDLTRHLLLGEIDSGFALVRPPGHHAESRRAMGFCLFNNAAVAAQYALSQPGIERVAIVDFDAHHGNGTQEIFYRRPEVLYLSSHQYPLYPGTGHWREVGEEEGRGYTVNFPVAAGAGNSFFENLYADMVVPILRQYDPDLILVSAGYDAHRDDPLAGLTLTETGFRSIAEQLNAVSDGSSSGRILYVLEGGYNLPALCNSVLETIEARLEPVGELQRSHPPRYYSHYLDQALRYYGGYWNLKV